MICERIKLYEGRDDVTLTTYIQDDSPELMNGRRRGAVLVCPGGGYFYCSDREGEPVALALAAQGYDTFVLRYSVFNHNDGPNTNENIVPDPSKPWVSNGAEAHPGPIRDLGKAMQYIVGHAEAWHIDVNKLALAGFSAGAHNCAMYCVYYDDPMVKDFLGLEQGIRPACAIIAYGLSDFRIVMAKPDHPTAEMWYGFMKSYFGGNGITDELLDELSPYLHVTEHTPPMFIWATAGDQAVPNAHSLKLAAALDAKKVPYELHIFEEGRHGLALATQESASGIEQIRPDVAPWLALADTWLKKRLAADFTDEIVGL